MDCESCFTLRFSDTPRPLPCPRYDPTALSPARKKMVETVILSLLSDASSDPERTEGHIQSRVSALFDDFRKEDRRRRQDERHTLISKLDACERSMRQQGNDGPSGGRVLEGGLADRSASGTIASTPPS